MIPDLKTPLVWGLGLALVAALATAGIERARVYKAQAETSTARAELTSEKLARSVENTARTQAALDDATKIAKLQSDHATAQQESENAFQTQLKTVEARGAADADYRRRMSGVFAASAARDRLEATSDTAACERVSNQPEVVAALLDGGIDLLVRGREIIEARDAEVALLLGIIRNDRTLLTDPFALLPYGLKLKTSN